MKFIYTLVAIPLLISSLSIDVRSGQQGQRSSGDYDQIGLFDGDLNFSLPLMNIGGRGTSSAFLFLNIRQPILQTGSYSYPSYQTVSSNGYEQVCNVSYTTTTVTLGNQTATHSEPYVTGCENVPTWEARYVVQWNRAEWLYHREIQEIDPGYGPGKFYGRTEQAGYAIAVSDGSTSVPDEESVGATRIIYRFDLPDGSSHTFVDAETKGSFASWSIVSGQPTCPNRGRNFVSVDGSSMTFVSDNDVSSCGKVYSAPITYDDGLDNYTLPSGYLFGNGGTKYRIEQGLIKWIKDRNGNKTSFYYDTTGRLTKAVDSLEREVNIVYDINDGETSPDGTLFGLRDEIRFKTINEQDQKIVLTKSDLDGALIEGQTLRTLDYLWQFSSHEGSSPIFTKKVVTAVWMPGGTATRFKYDNYAMLRRADYPTGRAVEYDYELLTPYTDNGVPVRAGRPIFRRRLTEKRVYSESSDPASLTTKTTFSPIYNLQPWGTGSPPTTRPVEVRIMDASGSTLGLTNNYFYDDPTDIIPYASWSTEGQLKGKDYKVETINPLTSQVFERVEKTWRIRDGHLYPAGCETNPLLPGCYAHGRMAIDTVVAETITTLEPNVNGGLVRKVSAINPSDGSLAFDSYNNRTDLWEYEFGVGSALTIPVRHTHWDYLTVNPANGMNYAAPSNGIGYTSSDLHIRSLTSGHFVYYVNQSTGQETLIGKTETAYDESSFPLLTEPSVPQWEDPLHSYRGNPTTSKVWYQEGSNWLESHSQFDQFGNIRKVWDASGDANKFVETQYDSIYKYAFPTKVIAPAPDPTDTHGANQTSTAETTYDFSTGLPLSVKNDFGQITRTEYDGSLRPWRVFAENFTAPESQTIYGVPDSNGQIPPNQRFVKVRKQIDATNWDEAITWADGLGRTIKTQASDSQGTVFVETHYDTAGRADRVTNPYRAGDTVFWSKTRFDEMGRAVESYAPTELANLGSAQSLGVTSFDISTVPNFVGTVVSTTDASGRKGRSITNALGQLLRVDEPTGIGGTADSDLGTLASPLQPTFYKYDFYGKMVEVTQGVQKRWFKYDSLGRLIRVRQPEQEINAALNLADAYNTSGEWTAGFAYDLIGNVVRATDANGVNIVNEYDRGGRVTQRCYTKPGISTTATTCAQIAGGDASTDTPTVEFYYDGKGLSAPQSPNFAKGKLTRVISSVSETQYQLFDDLGRLTQSAQITDGDTYTSKYTYNLSGALVEEEYPSGRVVRNEFEPDGDLLKMSSQKAGSNVFAPYASNFSYTASGGVSQTRLGNGRWETAKFNTRLQVTELGLGNSATDGSVWKTAYEYGELDVNGNVDAAKNTGNIARQTLAIPGTSFVQSYKYDSLYRLTEAVEKTGSSTNWSQQFGYDRYGNRTAIDQVIASITLNTTPAIDENTNRFSGSEFGYDKNGNVVGDIDAISSLPRQFIFNGDNKQVEVKKDGVTVGRYYYDGEGKRIKKVTDTETTIFVYSAGKLIAEYSTVVAAPEQAKTAYTTIDHLGTPRIITDELGQVKARRDFMPFGEELYTGIGVRSASLNYGTSEDDIRQKFTGYQKDNETGLDFAEARMYENRFGRFTAVDPLLASGKSANPQTFNRFIYVGNNPIIITDPSGLDWYQQAIENSDRFNYQWFDENPGGDWKPVDFGDKLYLPLPDWIHDRTLMGTGYLDRYANKILTEFEYNKFLNRDLSLGCLGLTSVCVGNPAAIFDQFRALKTGSWNFLASTANLPVEAPLFNGLGFSHSARQLFNLPLILDYAEYQNKAEAQAAFQVQAVLTVSSFAAGGAARSGISNFRAGGATFGEQLFNSKSFGKSSYFFGNSQYGGTSGILNRPGSFAKVGWSGGRQEMNFFNPRYSNGLMLDANSMGRSSFTGGGRQFRFTLGASGNQGSRHLFVPRTFVPDSIANPLMF